MNQPIPSIPPTYPTIGNPSDKPLVFLHGLGAGSAQTTSAFPNLPHTYLIAPDMPGHGENQPSETSNFSFDHFADLTVDGIKKLGYQSVDLGGLSMGSGIALNIALRYPEIVDRLIILRPSWLQTKEPDHLKLVAWVGLWIENHGSIEAQEKLRQCPLFQTLKKANPPVADSIMGLFKRPLTAASTAVLYKMWQDAPFQHLDDLKKITHPTLILTTGRDELHPQSTADLISEQLPHCESIVLPPRYHQGEAYNERLRREVRRFLYAASTHSDDQ